MRLAQFPFVACLFAFVVACQPHREDNRVICDADLGTSNASSEAPVWSMRRLTPYELSQTYTSLIGQAPAALDRLPHEDGDALPAASSFEVDVYRAAAEEVADSGAKSLLRRWQCAGNAGCLQRQVLHWLERAYRNPLDPVEREGYARFFASSFDAHAKLRGLLEVVFQSPRFLYLIESGAPKHEGDGVRELTSYELATRLAYFMWSEPPDDALIDIAARGQLQAPATLREQAVRMVRDPRTARMIGHVLQKWAAPELDIVAKADTVYPEFDPKLRAAMIEQFDQFAEMALRDDLDLRAILSTRRAPVNARLAPLLGVPARDAGSSWKLIDLPAPRFGVLTLPGVLTANARADDSSPVQRGLFVRQSLLCQTMPPPPKGVPPLPAATANGTSFRERFEAHTSSPVCATCHSRMDPLGFPFEVYDGLGRLRGNPETIDTRGSLVSVQSPAEFADLTELVELLLASQELPACWAQLWVQRALGATSDEALVADLSQKVVAGISLRGLLVELAMASAFRQVHRPQE
jgi:hypothetical protein